MTSNSPIDFISTLSAFNKNLLTDLVESEDFAEYLNDYLADHTIVVEFTKKNGETRRMKCTRNFSLIPSENHPSNTIQTSASSIRVFDLDKMEWRSFIPSSITRIEWGMNYNNLH
jgi:hypothetical protein